MKLRGNNNLHPIALHAVSPEMVRLLVKFDALMLAGLILLSQTT
jgi:hypothetical protein